MKRILFYILVIALGLIVGAVSALFMSGLLGQGGLKSADINAENWFSDWSIGASSADAYTRARVARHGLLALTKSEAVYFTRAVDDAGAPLSADCTYRLSGGDQRADWWSITLYDRDSRLPMNTDNALSIDATSVPDRSSWAVSISPESPKDGAWLSSRKAGNFDVTLRLYRPDESIISAPEDKLNPPRIERLSCDEEGRT